jgi:hypothetical protein
VKLKLYIIIIGLLSLIVSCKQDGKPDDSKSLFSFTEDFSSKSLLPSEYVNWVQDEKNGLKKEKNIEDITFFMQYKPVDYVICQEEKNDSIKKELRNKKASELSDMEYYDLKIMITNGEGELLKYGISSPQDYNERVKYYAFQMQNDISMVENGDTIPCGLYHFERAYDVSPFSTFLLGFKKSKKEKVDGEKTIIFYDKVYDKGIIKFTFNNKEQNNIPKLRTI